jgi:hypothetical protein
MSDGEGQDDVRRDDAGGVREEPEDVRNDGGPRDARDDPPGDAREGGIANVIDALGRSFARRLGDYVNDAEKRIRDQTALEPQGWLRAGTQFWLGLIRDVEAQLEGEGDAGATSLPVCRMQMRSGVRRLTLPLRVPSGAFGAQGAGHDELTLAAGGFALAGLPPCLVPGKHFEIVPARVRRERPWTELRFFDLPAQPGHALVPGVYACVIWAREASSPLLVCELAVID